MGKPGPRPEVTAEDVLDLFREREDASEPLTAPEVADRLGCSRRTALKRLHALADSGEVVSKKVGGRSLVWWIPDTNSDKTAPAAPLRDLVGMLDEGEAERARERSREWREEFDREMAGTGEP
jgi:biotin operon repressor